MLTKALILRVGRCLSSSNGKAAMKSSSVSHPFPANQICRSQIGESEWVMHCPLLWSRTSTLTRHHPYANCTYLSWSTKCAFCFFFNSWLNRRTEMKSFFHIDLYCVLECHWWPRGPEKGTRSCQNWSICQVAFLYTPISSSVFTRHSTALFKWLKCR